MPLVLMLESHDAKGITNDTIEFHWSSQLKWGVTWVFGHVMPLAPVSVSYMPVALKMAQLNFLMSKWLNKVQHDVFGYVMHQCLHHMMPVALKWPHWIPYVKTIKIRCNMTFFAFCSFYTIGKTISIMWCWWCCKWHHWIPYVKTIKIRYKRNF